MPNQRLWELLLELRPNDDIRSSTTSLPACGTEERESQLAGGSRWGSPADFCLRLIKSGFSSTEHC